jgi:hypothetical protein
LESIDYELDPNKIVGLRLQAKFWRYGMSEAKYIEDIFSSRPIKNNIYETYLPGFQFDIIAEDDDYEAQKIGYIKGKLCDEQSAHLDGVESLFDLCDQVDERAADIYEFMHYENINPNSTNYFTIDYVYINKKYRHHNLATAAVILLAEAISTQLNREAGIFVVAPASPLPIDEDFDEDDLLDLDEESFQPDAAKSMAFWYRLGFRQISDFMYFDSSNGATMQTVFMDSTEECHCHHDHAEPCECETPANVFDFLSHKRRK